LNFSDGDLLNNEIERITLELVKPIEKEFERLDAEDNHNDHDGDTQMEKSNTTTLETPVEKQNDNAIVNNTTVSEQNKSKFDNVIYEGKFDSSISSSDNKNVNNNHGNGTREPLNDTKGNGTKDL